MSFFQVGRSPIMTIKSQVLALKYRPQNFKDLIGQEEIAQAIFNSIKINRSSNAFLFTGIRGVGKTTFARIVAKALNCKNGIENLCVDNFCSDCKSIINSNHIDVLEMDAASKTGVDDVRELIEFSRYPPSIAKFKVFIIDEVHMLSKQAFNALLKTLEEPPKYLKFIFATTEVKKIPITVISRCQRYDLSRVKSEKLFEFIKSIGKKENKEIEDNAIKLIVKISEGSVRDALSLLDRAIISAENNLLTFDDAQKIFGYANKSSYINLLENIFKGNESSVLDHYKKIYNAGVEPNNFLNEFLEVLYYIKNIKYLKVEGSSFSLNDSEHKNILLLAKKIEIKEILLFWEFTLKTLREIHIVTNPNLSIEMFLLQLMHLIKKDSNTIPDQIQRIDNDSHLKSITQSDSIDQIKNTKQEKEKIEKKTEQTLKSLEDLIQLCSDKKEIKLKYEIENNVNLVSFSNSRIEIGFNEKLSKNFVKDLSEKLLKWTNTRWIISFSKEKGDMSNRDAKKIKREKDIKNFKNSKEFTTLKSYFPDIDLIDLKKKDD